MILLCGIPSETPLAMVAGELDHLGAVYTCFNQRRFASMDIHYTIDEGRVSGELTIDSDTHHLSSIQGCYVRLMDDRLLPEVENLPETSQPAQHSRRVHDTLTRWLEVTPARVVSRYSAMGSNGSKPYQAQLIQAFGFKTPETLVTNDPDAVIDFWHHHGRIIYKSISGQRSIVTEFTQDDLDRLEAIRSCPTQFQQMVDGTDVRLHVVGSRVFATEVTSAGVDYRYSRKTNGDDAVLRPIDVPDAVAGRAVALTRSLGLPVSGIDLMVDRQGDIYCLEVNPSPAFSYYESHTGQPVAGEIARLLAGRAA
jgi:glutathione synthase/RimK-type ligase-like ATP-grasp enzyme